MYRRCVLCGWGRKEVVDTIKFYCIPKEAGLQRLKWMTVLSDKRANGFKKVDSVCSIHFHSGKPSNDSTNPDFVPSLNLLRTDIPDSVRKESLIHYIQETEETATATSERRQKLDKLKERMNVMKKNVTEPKDAWVKRKQERIDCARKNGVEIPERFWTEVDYSQQRSPPKEDPRPEEPVAKRPRGRPRRPVIPEYEEYVEEVVGEQLPAYSILEDEPYQGVELEVDVISEEPEPMPEPDQGPDIEEVPITNPVRMARFPYSKNVRPHRSSNVRAAPGPSRPYLTHAGRIPPHVHHASY